MNPMEALAILRIVKALCPSQMLDEYTPEVWAEMLADVRFDDARLAVRELGRTPLEAGKPLYIQPGHIIHAVREAKGLNDPNAWMRAHD